MSFKTTVSVYLFIDRIFQVRFNSLFQVIKCEQVCSVCHNDGNHTWSRNCFPFRITWNHPGLNGVCVVRSLVFCVVFCRSLLFFVVLFSFGYVLRFSTLFQNSTTELSHSNLNDSSKSKVTPLQQTPPVKVKW